jgi:hypothetical protein
MKQTQRAKDYAVIGELARRLPAERELELTTDPDRLLALAERFPASTRPAADAAGTGDRRAVVHALADEVDALQRAYRDRLRAYEEAARPFLAAIQGLRREELALPGGHRRLVALAERLLPPTVAS